MSGMNFKGASKRLDDIDLPRIAHRIGCGEDHLHAVLEVETRGGGFDRYGRPKMLFEPHVFYRYLKGAEREAAVQDGLAYAKWGEEGYPRDSYPRLKQAMEINVTAALKSCSWGLGQVMGFNHDMVGYDSPADMVEAMLDDEETHLEAMVEFIVAAGLDDDLRREDWRGFARGYNGPGYAQHGYHTKLSAAFRKWQGIPDTPFHVDRNEVDPNPPVDTVRATRGRALRRGMRGDDVRLLQGTLADLGFFAGQKDGIFGRRTAAAVLALQEYAGIKTDSIVGENTWTALERAEPEPERDVTEDDLRAEGSRTVDGADKVEIAGAGMLSLPFINEGMAAAQEAQGFTDWAASLVGDNWPFLLGGVALFAALMVLTKNIRGARVDDAKKGRNLAR